MPRKTMETLTEAMFYVLMAFRRGELCGVEVSDWVEEKTGGRLRLGPATLYTILGKFEKEKLLRETLVEGRKRTYVLTRKGEEAYLAEVERLRACLRDAEAEEEEVRK
ncbi:MAG: helix-turn-helix transcriptional regulator [Oscillospiraceae bacterium]|nr:helix-turn-helix transcriptional regulator [Oscillospiraceae bacterium]